MQPRKDAEQEVDELKTAPIRWFAGLKSLIETEPALDLGSVFLGEG